MTKKKTQPVDVVAEQAPPSHANSLANSMLAIIDKSSSAGNVSVDKMRAMLDMQMELVRDQRLIEFSTSMADAQSKMVPIVRSDKGERKNYAKLERIDHEIRPIYTAAGFTLSFNSQKQPDGAILMKCKCLHRSGHIENYELEGNLDTEGAKGNANKTSIQGLGSSVSYLRRYLTCMIFNVVLTDEDNDGNAVIGPKKKVDEFGAAVAAATPAGKVSDADFEEVTDGWDGKYIETLGKRIEVPSTGTMPKTGAELIRIIGEVSSKEDRDTIYNKNTALIRALDKVGLSDLVAQMQTLVDSGE